MGLPYVRRVLDCTLDERESRDSGSPDSSECGHASSGTAQRFRIDNKIYSKLTLFSPISIQHSFLRSLLASSAYNKQDGSNELCLKRRNAHKHTASPVAAPKSVEPRVP